MIIRFINNNLDRLSVSQIKKLYEVRADFLDLPNYKKLKGRIIFKGYDDNVIIIIQGEYRYGAYEISRYGKLFAIKLTDTYRQMSLTEMF